VDRSLTLSESAGDPAGSSAVDAHLAAWDAKLEEFEESQHVGAARHALRRMRRNKLLLSGSVLGIFMVFLAVFGPIISGADYRVQDFSKIHQPPLSEGHILGTDQLGRDTAIRLFIGIRVSLIVAAGVTALAVVAGILIGTVGAWSGGWTDRLTRGAVDFVWGFPLILVAVLFASGFGGGLFPVILAIGLVNTAAIARVVRGEVLALKEQEFIEAARAAGVGTVRTMARHILPNILAPTLVLASYYVAVAIVAEAALAFIGLGAQPPLPSLGQMVSDGRNFLRVNHWESTVPGIAIVMLVLSVSLIGDGLRDVFDPRLQQETKGADK